MNYAFAHRPWLRYQFSPMKAGGGRHQVEGDPFQQFLAATEGSGCRRDGGDGRRGQRRLCIRGHEFSSNPVPHMRHDDPGRVGRAKLTNSIELLDGDTLTLCPSHSSYPWQSYSYDFAPGREVWREAYWSKPANRQVPVHVAEARRDGELVVAVHFRNGDITGKDGKALANHNAETRYAGAHSYKAIMESVAALPAGCTRVFVVTEDRHADNMDHFANWFNERAAAPLRFLPKKTCDAFCALSTFAHSDVLVPGLSGFSFFGAVLANDSTLVAFIENAHWALRAHQTGHAQLRASNFSAHLRAKLPTRCTA